MDVESTGPDLVLEVRLDGGSVFQSKIHEPQKVTIEVNDDEEKDHILEIELKGKSPAHTKIDAQGNILEDRVLKISNLTLDDVAIGYRFNELSTYFHDRNGTGPQVEETFFGEMGCNGIIRFKFSTPIYLWLLENL